MLLWRMADEPILCFDGDRAGQKAAFRAADLALPHLKPGKSLRFALLPEGQDPDDLARSGGRGAIEEVIAAARPLAEVIWLREIEGGAYATPERRAALEARINELAQSIRDEVVRKYYRQDLQERLQRAVASEGGRGGYGRGRGNFKAVAARAANSGRNFQPRGAPARAAAAAGGGFAQAVPAFGPGPYQAASPQLATSPLIRGQRSALSRREALILKTLLNHPWLLHEHLEEVAALELAHPEAHRCAPASSPPGLPTIIIRPIRKSRAKSSAPTWQKRGFSELLQRVERSITNRRSGARKPARRSRMFWPPGSSSSPCIINGIPYLGN